MLVLCSLLTRPDSVLALFRDYPGEPVLQAYLEHALRDGVLSLPIYVTTFLAAARSVELHNVSTLDLLCRVAQYHVGMPLVAFGESPIVLFNTVQDAMALVKTACTLPSTHYHGLTDRASDLLCRLLEIAMSTELTNISTVQMQIVFNGANETLVSLRGISPHLKSKLEDMLFHLYDAIGDDSKAAREAQMMQTLQLALGKGDVIGANFDRDIISCGLMLEALVCRPNSRFVSIGHLPCAYRLRIGRTTSARGMADGRWCFSLRWSAGPPGRRRHSTRSFCKRP